MFEVGDIIFCTRTYSENIVEGMIGKVIKTDVFYGDFSVEFEKEMG